MSGKTGHSVIWSFGQNGHLINMVNIVIWSSGHLVFWSSGHLVNMVIWSKCSSGQYGYLVIWLSGHLVICHPFILSSGHLAILYSDQYGQHGHLVVSNIVKYLT